MRKTLFILLSTIALLLSGCPSIFLPGGDSGKIPSHLSENEEEQKEEKNQKEDKVDLCKQYQEQQHTLGEKCQTLAGGSKKQLLKSPKKALVIGNNKYVRFEKLDNPSNDATDVSVQLERFGFHVTRAFDLTKKEMETILKDFRNLFNNSKQDAVAFVFFAGHGARSSREDNYLIPVVDEQGIHDEHSLSQNGIQIKRDIITKLKEQNNGETIVVADACRNDPYKTRSTKHRGLKLPELSDASSESNVPVIKGGVLVAFSASEDELVPDRSHERNSLFTKHFKKNMEDYQCAPIEDIFRNTAIAVKSESHGEQNPVHSAELAKTLRLAECNGK